MISAFFKFHSTVVILYMKDLLVESPCRIWYSKCNSQQPLQNRCRHTRCENSTLAWVTAHTSQKRNVSLATRGCTFLSIERCLDDTGEWVAIATDGLCIADLWLVWDAKLPMTTSLLEGINWVVAVGEFEADIWRSCELVTRLLCWGDVREEDWDNVWRWVGTEATIDGDNRGDWDGIICCISDDDHLLRWRYILASDGDICKDSNISSSTKVLFPAP